MIGFLKESIREKYGLEKTHSPYELVLDQEIRLLRAWALWWAANTIIKVGVYYRSSIGRGATYCNVAAYDFFDSRCEIVWNVNVQVGSKIKEKFPMGNVLRAYDFDISPILKNNDLKNVLGTPPKLAYENALKAAEKNKVKILTSRLAAKKAEFGIPSMIIHPGLGVNKIGHLAIIIPNFRWEKNRWMLGNYDSKKGCLTANVGWDNDIMYVSDKRGFGNYLHPDSLSLKQGKAGIKSNAIIVEFKDYNTNDYLEL